MTKAVTKRSATAPASAPTVPTTADIGKTLPLDKPEGDPATLQIRQLPEEPQKQAIARNLTKPSVNGAITIRAFSPRYENILDLMALADVLADEGKKAQGGDLNKAEGMLMIQAHTLDAMFRSLAVRGAANMGEFPDAAETYIRLAMKAQSQCRATLETLAEIKNPLAGAYVRQANVAGGHQQVNNAPPLVDPSQARGNESTQNKLLEANHGERMDTGAAQAAGGANQAMATLEPVNRPKVEGRKAGGRAKRVQGRNKGHAA